MGQIFAYLRASRLTITQLILFNIRTFLSNISKKKKKKLHSKTLFPSRKMPNHTLFTSPHFVEVMSEVCDARVSVFLVWADYSTHVLQNCKEAYINTNKTDKVEL